MNNTEILRRALAFYADPKNWTDTPSWDGDPYNITPMAIPVRYDDGMSCDCGKTAREALALISTPSDTTPATKENT